MISATAPNPAPILSVRNLSVSFRGAGARVLAVDDVSFDVFEGETLAILGESGSGKSVTAQALMGLLPKRAAAVESGSIVYRGVDLLTKPTAYTRSLCGPELAMVFQDPLSSLNPVLRVGDQIVEGARKASALSHPQARALSVELLDRVGIPDPQKRVDSYPHQFSGGMRQRVMIAMALSQKPKVLIADEPTTALDVTVQAQIMELLGRLRSEEGMALVLISHDLGLVADVADRAAIMYSGRVVEQGAVHALYAAPRHPYTEGLLASIPTLSGPPGRLTPIRGGMPDPATLPPGCVFSPRCDYATSACDLSKPRLMSIVSAAGPRRTACIRHEEVGSHD